MQERIELDKLFVRLASPNIVVVTAKNNCIIDAPDIIELKKLNMKLTKGKKYVGISDSGNYTTITKEGRELLAKKSMEKNRIGTAFVINSLSQRVLANFFININNPGVPTRIFATLTEALDWSKELLTQSQQYTSTQ